ncbi:hypothetical protein PACTADRAFT_24742, partial [Pachysolen tannophilus NRRL Y-2460]
KNQKSRNGCITCKKKRLKCDEAHPSCMNCTRKGLVCGGYAVAFKWKSFEETTTGTKFSMSNSNYLLKALEDATLSVTGKTYQEVALANALIASGRNPALAANIRDNLESLKQAASNVEVNPNTSISSGTSLKQDSITTNNSKKEMQVDDANITEAPTELTFSNAEPVAGNYSSSVKPESELELNQEESSIDNNSSSQYGKNSSNNRSNFSPSFSPFTMIPDFYYHNTKESPDNSAASYSPNSFKNSLTPQFQELLNVTGITDGFIDSPRLTAINNALHNNTTKNEQGNGVLAAYDRYTCAILSIRNGPTENPWRSQLLPLAKKHTVIFNALGAMTCFHIARGDEVIRSKGMKYMKSSIIELANGLSSNSMSPDVALTTCLALAVGEAWDRHISTGMTHLRGAESMIIQILKNIRKGSDGRLGGFGNSDRRIKDKEEESNNNGEAGHLQYNRNNNNVVSTYRPARKLPAHLQFLFNSFIYFDTLARITSETVGDDPFSESVTSLNESAIDSDSDNELDSLEGSSKRTNSNNNRSTSIREQFHLMYNFVESDDDIDPLLGCGQTLFPLIAKAINLIGKAKREFKNSLSTVSSAVAIKSELEKWMPSSHKITNVEDPSLDLTSCISTAEAYRYATLIYLHQAVPEIPSRSSHALAEKVLMLLASIPTTSKTYVTHIFPLLIASCEVNTEEEKEWVLDRWDLFARKMWIGNIDRSLEVVKEVWRRKDIAKKKKNEVKQKIAQYGRDGITEQQNDKEVLANKIYGYVAAANGEVREEEDFELSGIKSRCHWSQVMKEWGWEVFLG